MPDHRVPLARRLIPGVGIGMAAGLLGWLLSLAPLVEMLELKTYDLRMRRTARPAASHDEILLVSINDDSLRRLEDLVGRWPWPRLVHATLVDFLARGPAKVILYDVLFTEADRRRFTVGEEEWTGERSDLALAESIASAGTVVLAADASAPGLLDESKDLQAPLDGIPALARGFPPAECVERRPILVPPIAPLARAALAIGHTFVVRDPDGPLRRTVPFVRVADRMVPSLAVAGVVAARDLDAGAVRWLSDALEVGSGRLPLVHQIVPDYYGKGSRACRALIAYRGPTMLPEGTTTFREFSFYDLFYSEEQIREDQTPNIDPSLFKDRIVVVGTTAAGLDDLFTVPFAEGAMPGAEVHANVIDSLLSVRSLRPMDPLPALALTVAAGLAVGLVGAVASAWTAGAWAAGAAAVLVWASIRVFAAGVWMPVTGPFVAIAIAFTGDLAWRYLVEGREKRRVKKLFSRFVARDVFDRLMADPSLAALGGVRRNMTVLFSDVRGFTAMSEKASPEDVVRQLNEYFTRMVEVLFERRGTLDKFVGDMVMALFGAPLDDPDHADHAVETALAMSQALDELNAKWAAEGRPALDIGIGISTGDMVAGNIGSDTIMSYTVIGDAVNLGARLEALNKEYATRIIIGEATRAALKGRYDVRPLGSVTVKGKSQSVAIYEVRAPAQPAGAEAREAAPEEVKR